MMYDYHHLMLCVRSVLLTNMSNQAPQLSQISHSPHCCGPTSYPTLHLRPETLYHPRNSSPHPIVDTHLVPPRVPFEIPCPICHGAIERGECHHHSERDIVWSSSSNLQWLKKVPQYWVILKRLENCGISRRNQARCLQDGWKGMLLAFQNYFGHVTWLPWRQDTGILKWYVTRTLIWPYIYQSLFHIKHRNLTAVDGCSVTKVFNYVGDIIPSDINILCSTPIDSPPHKVHFYSTRANILVISEYGLSTC